MPERREAVIISAARTPTGKFQGALKGFAATDLGALVVREAVRRAGVAPEDVDEVIMGCVIQAGLGQNPARQAALKGGIPFGVSAVTINKVCGSGLKSVMMAAQAIQLGDSEVVVAGVAHDVIDCHLVAGLAADRLEVALPVRPVRLRAGDDRHERRAAPRAHKLQVLSDVPAPDFKH